MSVTQFHTFKCASIKEKALDRVFSKIVKLCEGSFPALVVIYPHLQGVTVAALSGGELCLRDQGLKNCVEEGWQLVHFTLFLV